MNNNNNKLKLQSPIDNFKKNTTYFLNTYFFNNDITFLLLIIVILVIISLFSLASYENMKLVRYSFINNTFAIFMSIIFIYIIVKNMNNKNNNMTIFSINIEVGYILYILIIFGLFILFSN